MSDRASGTRTLVLGGGPSLGFAVAREDVARLVPARDLPAGHRRVTVPRLFDGAAGTDEPRFAEVAGAEPATFLDLGGGVRVRAVPEEALEPIPPILATTARRWGWKGLVREETGFWILLDVAWLASLAAPRPGAAVPEARP